MSNKNVLFIEDNGFQLAKIFDAISVRYENQDKDQAIEGWLIKIFEQYPNIEKIVIPEKLGKDDVDNTGLRVGLHIRLTENLKAHRFIPIIFLSETPKDTLIANQILSKRDKTATLLNTPNCKIVPIDKDAIMEALANFKKPLDEKRFKSEGLPNLIIETHRDRGHQLANEWGCIRLATLGGVELTQIVSSDLYFKYRLASMQDGIGKIAISPKTPLYSKDINVLLIDDNAKKGWEEVIKKILDKHIVDGSHKVNISSIESVEDFQRQKNDIEKFNLVLLDLRLSKNEENSSRAIKIEDFSGSKVLKEIKNINKGIQTIILTASNKAWNMQYLLDEGANGYYIKESPEIVLTDEFSVGSFSNFIDSVKSAINRHYLKAFFKSHKAMALVLKNLIPTANPNFKKTLEEIDKYLEISFEMVYAASNESDKKKSEDSFGYAYLSLFRVVEKINDYFIEKIPSSTNPSHRIKGTTLIPLNNYTFNIDGRYLINHPISTQNYSSPSPQRINRCNFGDKVKEFSALTGICIDKLGLLSFDLIRKVYWSVERRNKFIHADTSISGELETECDKIKTYEGYEELLDILEKIICHPNFN